MQVLSISGLAAVTVTTFIMGAYSDKIGKRRPILIYSFILWGITTAIFPLSGYLKFNIPLAIGMAVLFDSIMTFFGSTACDATLNAYVTDVTTDQNRGRVMGVWQMMFMLSILLVYGASGFLMSSIRPYNYFYVIGAVTGTIGFIGALRAPESENLQPSDKSIGQLIKSTFSKDAFKENKNFFLLQGAIAIWNTGFNVFFPFVMIYLEFYLQFSTLDSSLAIFFPLLIAMVLSIPMGKAVDKFGRKKIGVLFVVVMSVALLFFANMTDFVPVVLAGTFWVLGLMAWFTVSRTWTKDLVPEEKRGQFHGFYLLFNVLIGMTVGPFIGNIIAEASAIPYTSPEGVPGYIPPPLIFIVGAIIILFSIIPLCFAKDIKSGQKQA